MASQVAFDPGTVIQKIRTLNKQPKHVQAYGKDFIIYPEVFDGSFAGALIDNFIMNNLEALAHSKLQRQEKVKFLEVGSGMGQIAIEFALRCNKAQVCAADVSPAAVENTRANISLHGLINRVTAVQADVFQAESLQGLRFDVIFFRPPAGFCEDGNEGRLDSIEQCFWDPGYNIVRRYLSEARRYLEEDGRLLLTAPLEGWGVASKVMENIAREEGWQPHVMATIDPIEGKCSGMNLYNFVDIGQESIEKAKPSSMIPQTFS